MNNAFPSLSAWPKFFGVMRESPFAGQSLDRKTQEQIVKELKKCLGSFKSAQPDFLNHEMIE